MGVYSGFGSAHDSSNGTQSDTFSDGTLYRSPHLVEFFMQFGTNVFFNKQVGVGAELSWRPSQGDYEGLQYRPSLYSFDAIFRPAKASTKRFEPEFRVGLGAARVRYSFDDPLACDQVPGCLDSTHFRIHLGAAPRIYLKDHIFLRPAFDVHYVKSLF